MMILSTIAKFRELNSEDLKGILILVKIFIIFLKSDVLKIHLFRGIQRGARLAYALFKTLFRNSLQISK